MLLTELIVKQFLLSPQVKSPWDGVSHVSCVNLCSRIHPLDLLVSFQVVLVEFKIMNTTIFLHLRKNFDLLVHL